MAFSCKSKVQEGRREATKTNEDPKLRTFFYLNACWIEMKEAENISAKLF